MMSRFGAAIALAVWLGSPGVVAREQAAAPRPAKAASALEVVDLIPMTCAQAWAASGKDYGRLYEMLAALATVSLNNRDLKFPDSKEAGVDAGTSIAKDCVADPDQLLYALVDKHVRRIAEAATR